MKNVVVVVVIVAVFAVAAITGTMSLVYYWSATPYFLLKPNVIF